MKYLSTFEMAKKWGVTPRRVLYMIKSGRVPEAVCVGTRWIIPEDLMKPADARLMRNKAKEMENYTFRYPIFEHKDVLSFEPPLSKDELTIKRAVEAVNAMHAQRAEKLLGKLPERTHNRYIRITALYCKCMISMLTSNAPQFIDCYGRLKAEFHDDFPYKTEMKEFVHEIEASIGENGYYSNRFRIVPTYNYHESFLPRLCNLSTLWLAFGEKRVTPEDLAAYEVYCRFLEQTDNYFDLQAIHINLACAYSMLDMKDECNYHFRSALKLAEKYDMYYVIAAMQFNYMPKALDEALEGFSEEFKRKIASNNLAMRESHTQFIDTLHRNSLYKLISGNDYIYIMFAVQGLTNKEVAERMHTSISNVGKHYSMIYATLGVTNKENLVALYHIMTDGRKEIEDAEEEQEDLSDE